MIYKVTLNQLEFEAYHGLYDFEKQQGNTFYLTITIEKNLPDDYQFSDIDKTTDYEIIYVIAAKHMAEPTDLLEQVLQHIAVELKTAFVDVTRICLTLAKLNPPVGGVCKQSEVTLEYTLRD